MQMAFWVQTCHDEDARDALSSPSVDGAHNKVLAACRNSPPLTTRVILTADGGFTRGRHSSAADRVAAVGRRHILDAHESAASRALDLYFQACERIQFFSVMKSSAI